MKRPGAAPHKNENSGGYAMRKILLGLSMVFALTGAASAQTFKIHTGIIPPYINEAEGGKGSGVILEIMTGALSAANLNYEIVSAVPWKRAQSDAIGEPDSLVSPFARTPVREPDWTWVAKILEEKMYVYVPAGAAKPANKDDLLQVLSLGVLSGGAPESVAKELNLETVMQGVAAESMNAKKLVAGRLNAWMSQGYMATAGMREAEVPAGQIERKFELRDLPLWVATSKSTPPDHVALLQAAFENFLKTPAYTAVLAKYQ